MIPLQVRKNTFYPFPLKKYSTFSNQEPKSKARFKIPDDFLLPDQSSSVSSLSNLKWDPPSWRLTGVITNKTNLESLLEELETSKVHIAAFRKTKNIFFPRSLKTGEIESRSVYYRNILTKAICLDDQHRIEYGTSLFVSDEQQLRFHLEPVLDQVEAFIAEHSNHSKNGKCFGQLIRIYTALKVRMSNAETALTEVEKTNLQEILSKLRKQTSLHLAPTASLKLIEMDIQQIEAWKLLPLEERYEYIDLILPLSIGINTLELMEFVSLLHQSTQNELYPLIDLRNILVSNDIIWKQLINNTLAIRDELKQSLDSIDANVEQDLAFFESYPTFGRALLHHGKHFLDDLFANAYIMKIINLAGYFQAPHIMITMDEQHLNRQIFAAKDQLRQSETDPSLLKIQSSLNGQQDWIYVNEVTFANIYIPDDFQRLLSLENSRFFNEDVRSLSQAKKDKLYYLPERGLIRYNPHLIPENIDELTEFHTSNQSDSFSPAISYRTENSTLTGTHAFTEIHLNKKCFVIGKFLPFPLTYNKVNTYWNFFRNTVVGILNPQKSVLLSPDQNTGYFDRKIATLIYPKLLTPEQKQKIIDILHLFRTNPQVCDSKSSHTCQFVGHNNNCTGLTEEMLKAVDVNLPCTAPLHALLKINHPRFAGVAKWISNHPNLANPILVFLGFVLGAKVENRLSAESLEKIMTPYIPRLYVSLKNSTDPWVKQSTNNHNNTLARE